MELVEEPPKTDVVDEEEETVVEALPPPRIPGDPKSAAPKARSPAPARHRP